MSRSLRKTPIFGHTTARSEADDKRLWHKRWRSHQRDQLATAKPESEIVPIHRRIEHLGNGQRWKALVWPTPAARDG